jgi:hypothetical protein
MGAEAMALSLLSPELARIIVILLVLAAAWVLGRAVKGGDDD